MECVLEVKGKARQLQIRGHAAVCTHVECSDIEGLDVWRARTTIESLSHESYGCADNGGDEDSMRENFGVDEGCDFPV